MFVGFSVEAIRFDRLVIPCSSLPLSLSLFITLILSAASKNITLTSSLDDASFLCICIFSRYVFASFFSMLILQFLFLIIVHVYKVFLPNAVIFVWIPENSFTKTTFMYASKKSLTGTIHFFKYLIM